MRTNIPFRYYLFVYCGTDRKERLREMMVLENPLLKFLFDVLPLREIAGKIWSRIQSIRHNSFPQAEDVKRDFEIDFVSLAPIHVNLDQLGPGLAIRIRCTNKSKVPVMITSAKADFYCGVHVEGSVSLDKEVSPKGTLGIGGSLDNPGISISCSLNDAQLKWFEQHSSSRFLDATVANITIAVHCTDKKGRFLFEKSRTVANMDGRIVWIN